MLNTHEQNQPATGPKEPRHVLVVIPKEEDSSLTIPRKPIISISGRSTDAPTNLFCATTWATPVWLLWECLQMPPRRLLVAVCNRQTKANRSLAPWGSSVNWMGQIESWRDQLSKQLALELDLVELNYCQPVVCFEK